MPKKGYKTITVNEPTYQALEYARNELIEKGVNTIPKEVKEFIESTKCPICGNEMSGVEMKIEYYKCKCGFKKPVFNFKASGSFALGAITGIAIAYLIYLMSKKGELNEL